MLAECFSKTKRGSPWSGHDGFMEPFSWVLFHIFRCKFEPNRVMGICEHSSVDNLKKPRGRRGCEKTRQRSRHIARLTCIIASDVVAFPIAASKDGAQFPPSGSKEGMVSYFRAHGRSHIRRLRQFRRMFHKDSSLGGNFLISSFLSEEKKCWWKHRKNSNPQTTVNYRKRLRRRVEIIFVVFHRLIYAVVFDSLSRNLPMVSRN